ncbi:MAG: extracellular solute-binding protein [Candidatus Omnitrophica bacterium]|nr:extracellular solute-binding protein [Candidatus Omnitrophota bacterium]
MKNQKSKIKNQNHIPKFKKVFKFFNFSLSFWILIFGLWIFNSSGCAQRDDALAKKTITVWHWMTDRESAFQELAKRYEDETGIRINFELYAPSDVYSQKVRAAAQGRTLPDIYGLLGEKRDFAAFIKSGQVADLSEAMNEENGLWKECFFSKALEVVEFKENNTYAILPGIYGAPIDIMNIQMLYNKKLFKKARLDPERPPSNWEEFIDDIQKLKKVGVPGLVSGWGEIWMIDCFASNYAFNIMGEDKVIATLKGDLPYTDPEWIKVFSLFKELVDKDALASGIVIMKNKVAEQTFANERAAFAFNGSWCVNVYDGMNPRLEYAAFLPPKVNGKNPMYIWGGGSSFSFLVNDRSSKKLETIKFLKWLTDKDQQVYLSSETKNLPSNKFALAKIPKILAQFADDMDSTTNPGIWPVTESPAVIEALGKGIQSILIKEKTPESLAQELQAIKEKESQESF